MKKVIVSISAAMIAACFAWAGNITVTSPTAGDFLGKSNKLKFNITGSRAQARVTARVTSIADPNFAIERFKRFDPNVDGEISGELDLNFNDTTPAGDYRIVVTVTETGNPYPTITINPVTIDVKSPKFRDISPVNNAFVRNDVPIRVLIDEPNIEEWRVQVNGQDIPNNTGTSQTVNVTWRSQDVQNDGMQTISVRVEDKAKNENTRTVSVTLDRVAPSINILSPSTTRYRPGAIIPVAIDFNDQFANAVTLASVDVVLQDMSGNFLGRVARRSARNSGNTLQWTGRIRDTRRFPSQFKLVVNCVDRAGNPASPQELIVNLR